MSRTLARLRVLWRKGIKRRVRRALWFVVRMVLLAASCIAAWVAIYRWLPPPITMLMASEWARTGDLRRDWTPLTDISPNLTRSVIAAEDARFCDHYGFDVDEIRKALAETNRRRGASTISQQTAKNAFLWPAASWTRKGFEAGFTVMVELIWPKRRIMEVYLNIAEFDEGVFGAEAAAQAYYGKPAADLSLNQAARLTAVLPNPRQRTPQGVSASRAAAIADGAETLRRTGRADCIAPEAAPARG